MRWKYRLHHTWAPDERMDWAEAFVRPHDPTYTGASLWVTIDCARDEKLRAWLGNHPYRVPEEGEAGDSDLVVNARDFSKPEFLHWVEVWLRAKGLDASGLVEAPLSDFAGTHPHADFLIRLTNP